MWASGKANQKCLQKNGFFEKDMCKIWKYMSDIWVTSWENLFMPYANNRDADQPAQMRRLMSAFVVRCLDSIIPLLAITEISRL